MSNPRIVPEHAEPPLSPAASKGEIPRGGFYVKTILAAAMIVALGVTGILLWETAHARRMAVSSSQIFIHGTPVCVLQQGGVIIASVGTCDTPGGEATEDAFGNGDAFHGGTPAPVDPRFGLPPGHPPVDSHPPFEEERRTLI